MVFLRFPFEKGTRCLSFESNLVPYEEIRQHVISCLSTEDFALYYNGRQLQKQPAIPHDATIHVTFSLLGGKGGFGSMLRAIGAQIEKTTNREACRDLSGRRLRDINEEQRLKKWIAKKGEREAEKARRRKERIERLKSKPKHNFVDFEYEKEISQLPERIDDALSAGMQKAASKRPTQAAEASCSKEPSTKKKRLWFDEDLSGTDSDSQEAPSSTSENDSQEDGSQMSRSETSGNETSENSNMSEQKLDNAVEEQTTKTGNAEVNRSTIPNQDAEAGCSSASNESTSSVLEETNSSEVIKETSADSKDLEPVPVVEAQKEDYSPVDLLAYESISQLEILGLDKLKTELMARGLKCGGSISDRAQRLWKVRGLQPNEYPSNLLAKTKK